MPRSREPADVFYATDDELERAPTPEPTPPPKPAPKAKPKAKDTPPGPINLEIRTGMAGDQTRIALTQRVYDYDIQQTDETLTITGYLKPKADA